MQERVGGGANLHPTRCLETIRDVRLVGVGQAEVKSHKRVMIISRLEFRCPLKLSYEVFVQSGASLQATHLTRAGSFECHSGAICLSSLEVCYITEP